MRCYDLFTGKCYKTFQNNDQNSINNEERKWRSGSAKTNAKLARG